MYICKCLFSHCKAVRSGVTHPCCAQIRNLTKGGACRADRPGHCEVDEAGITGAGFKGYTYYLLTCVEFSYSSPCPLFAAGVILRSTCTRIANTGHVLLS